MGYLHILRVALVSAILFTSVGGHCTSPKVRREWRCISPDERAAWMKAVKCLTKLPHNPDIYVTVDPAVSLIPAINPNSSYYDDFSYAHMDLNILIHSTGFFLPWHRLFVQTLEDELKSKCGYDGVQPYWDWTQDTADFYHATIWSDSDYDGLGSWGNSSNDYAISTGALKDMKIAYPVPHNIRRNFTLQPFLGAGPPPSSNNSTGPPSPDPTLMLNATFTSEVVNFTVSSFTGDYIQFQADVESWNGPHPGPHGIVGGDLVGGCPFGLAPPVCYGGPKWSPNDPMFFLHHAMIDKVWYDWQHRDPRNKNVFAGGTVSWQAGASYAQYPTGGPPFLNTSSVIPGDGLWEKTTVSDVLDTVGGRLCYVYE
ncbi:Di-copper centre-containing protein [Thelephora terrestris]|uniref:Di-copper centre-containing protein n=1 Tax=Thelephora terrestris TaxID=56493 RepID=A0A9P6HFP7_9AGAM|nr:Di-copper centre-containing protein [Thelephora terrestris]